MKVKKVKALYQLEDNDCGLAAAGMILNYYFYHTKVVDLKKIFAVKGRGLSIRELKEVFDYYNFSFFASKGWQIDNIEEGVPYIFITIRNHYIVVERKNNNLFVYDPVEGKYKVTLEWLKYNCLDILILAKPRKKNTLSNQVITRLFPHKRMKIEKTNHSMIAFLWGGIKSIFLLTPIFLIDIVVDSYSLTCYIYYTLFCFLMYVGVSLANFYFNKSKISKEYNMIFDRIASDESLNTQGMIFQILNNDLPIYIESKYFYRLRFFEHVNIFFASLITLGITSKFYFIIYLCISLIYYILFNFIEDKKIALKNTYSKQINTLIKNRGSIKKKIKSI